MYSMLIPVIIGAVMSATSAAPAATGENGIVYPVMVNELNDKLSDDHNQGNTMCDVCEFLVKTLDYVLKGNKSEVAINSTMYKLCDLLPGTEKALCDMMAPMLVKQLEKGFDPHRACAAIRACANVSVEGPPQASEVNTHISSRETVKAAPECEFCEAVVEFVEEVLNKTPNAQINETVYRICDVLPGTMKQRCLDLAPRLVGILEDPTIEPHQACAVLGLCTDDKHISSHKKSQEEPQASLLCEVCELLVQLLDNGLQQNRTDELVNKTIYEICNDLPQTFQDLCYQLAPEVYKVIIRGVDPEKACSEIGVCSSAGHLQVSERADKEMIGPNIVGHSDTETATVLCEVCEFIVQVLDGRLHLNKTEALVNKTLNEICNDVPQTFQNYCYLLAPELYKVIISGVDPETACSVIRVCSSTEQQSGVFERGHETNNLELSAARNQHRIV